MSYFKCKMCGGTIEFELGATVGVCDSCGTKQTLPRLDDDRRANLYDRANHFRRNNEFDKAAGIYEQILTEDTTDAEAYWSLVLCQYGIEYVEDPATHKRIPTVNRAQFTSIFDDDNYKSALQYADAYQRVLYEQEANEINEIQKGILAISQKEDPFDVFICYKETDNNGRRTPDSVLANDLYHQLIQEGFKVFFARITLEDKLGTAYEPYIFAALNSSKVMVVLGTKPDYFNAVWVKNEWSRYLALVKKSGGKKILIPAYKDMDPYDLPEEFSHLQAQDMSKLGFMQDLLRGIKKIVTAETPKQTVKETVVVGSNTTVAPLLERAFISLEDREWEKADEFCEQVLNQEPKNARAYLGKLMAELKVSNQDELTELDQPFDTNSNYQKAIRYGDGALLSELQGYNTTIIERNEKRRLTGLYESAVETMKRAATEEHYKNVAADFKELSGFQNADELADQCLEKAEVCRKNEIYNSARGQKNKGTIESYEMAIRIFGQISGWKDADEQVDICRSEIEKIKERQEAERVEKERQQKIKQIAAKKAAKKRKISIAIVTILAVAGVTAFFLLTKVVIPNSKYNAALDLYNEGKFEEGISSFEALNGYKDSADQINICKEAILERDYNRAVELFNSGKYYEAIEAFTVLKGYNDSIEMIEKSSIELEYQNAIALDNSGKYYEAYNAFLALENYKDSSEYLDQLKNIILCNAQVGDIVIFGHFSDAKIYNEWIVLDKQGEKLFLISSVGIGTSEKYHNQAETVTWEKCSLRGWLNGEYITKAFSSEEQALIISTKNKNPNNPTYKTNGGNDTVDKVFLLSIDEVEKYFPTDSSRQLKTSTGQNLSSYWWLRTPGYGTNTAAGVKYDGSVSSMGIGADNNIRVVRPALWIDISSF